MALAALNNSQTLAQRFDVHPNQITDWKSQLLQRAGDVFAGDERAEPQVDIKGLHAKIGQLTLENDFLSGALLASKQAGARCGRCSCCAASQTFG